MGKLSQESIVWRSITLSVSSSWLGSLSSSHYFFTAQDKGHLTGLEVGSGKTETTLTISSHDRGVSPLFLGSISQAVMTQKVSLSTYPAGTMKHTCGSISGIITTITTSADIQPKLYQVSQGLIRDTRNLGPRNLCLIFWLPAWGKCHPQHHGGLT